MALPVKEEELVKAIRWKLGIPSESDPGRSEEICNRFLGDQTMADRVVRFLGPLFEDVIRYRMGLHRTLFTTRDEMELLNSLWKLLQSWIDAAPMKRSPLVSGLIRDSLGLKKSVKAPPTASSSSPTPAPAAKAPAPVRRPDPPPPSPLSAPAQAARKPEPPPKPVPPPAPPPSPPPEAVADPPAPAADPGVSTADPPNPTGANMTQGNDLNRPRPTGPAWQCKPVPESEPDRHPDSACTALLSPEGWPLYAARVRGKKHKHEGTNCDDWFRVEVAGPWTLIAVADGAGSKKFSRLGARASCDKAVEYLAKTLGDHKVRPGLTSADLIQTEEDRAFVEPSLEQVQKCLHNAMHAGYAALEEEVKRCQGSRPHKRQLLNNREVAIEDLSATLLLAAHTTIPFEGTECSLVMACQIGDGVTATIDRKGHIALLCVPDSGDYSGETDFLTSRRKLDFPLLRQRTFVQVQPLRALLVMSDGVADDYFPPVPSMARLYADLVLNGVLQLSGIDLEQAKATLSEHTLPSFDLRSGILDSADAMLVEQAGTATFTLRSAATLASELSKPVEYLAAAPHLLAAAADGTPLRERFKGTAGAELLRLWLDSYHVRGSFDDRTLVVLHREGV